MSHTPLREGLHYLRVSVSQFAGPEFGTFSWRAIMSAQWLSFQVIQIMQNHGFAKNNVHLSHVEP